MRPPTYPEGLKEKIMENNSSTGIIYVLTNPAMPGIVKIGKTSRGSVDARLNELYSTGEDILGRHIGKTYWEDILGHPLNN